MNYVLESRRKFLKTSLVTFGTLSLANLGFGQNKTQKGKTMKIAILAANGRTGRLITEEALNKGYSVSAFVRDSKKLAPKENLVVIEKDIFQLDTKDLQGFDVIIDCFGEWKDLSLHKKHIEYLVKILAGNKARFLVVGGAGSLYMDKTHSTRLMDTPSFPSEYLGVTKATADVLDVLRNTKEIHWVYVCPPAEFVFDAPKTGKYKIIGEEFETNAKGESKGSYADYATAMIEIAGDSKYDKQRMGVIGL